MLKISPDTALGALSIPEQDSLGAACLGSQNPMGNLCSTLQMMVFVSFFFFFFQIDSSLVVSVHKENLFGP